MSDDKNFPAYPAKIIDWQESGIQQHTVYEDQEEGLTARDVFAINAPDAPEWFKTMKRRETGAYVVAADEGDVFFEWRWYYADMMLKTR